VVSAVVLSFAKPVELAPSGTATVLSLRVSTKEAVAEGPASGIIRFVNGMQAPRTQPVNNAATAGGETKQFCELRSLRVLFVPGEAGGLFRRGDANADGRLDIADAVFSLDYQFRGGSAPRCLKTADADDDGDIDLGDPVRTLNYIFLAGSAPMPPFPGCGADPTTDLLACDAYPPCE
jgi:hypothetical protein